MPLEQGFFTNHYHNGYRGYHFYRCGTVPAGQKRSDSKNSNLNKK
jgi:hypothetical protein